MNSKKLNRQQGRGIRCPRCAGATRVYHSIAVPDKNEQHRYRICIRKSCGSKIYTVESVQRYVEGAE